MPKNVITNLTIGDEIELDVITNELNVITNAVSDTEKSPNVITNKEKNADNVITKKPSNVITPNGRFEMCSKHNGSFKMTCGCK